MVPEKYKTAVFYVSGKGQLTSHNIVRIEIAYFFGGIMKILFPLAYNILYEYVLQTDNFNKNINFNCIYY